MREHGFTSLRLVTADYHMPRALFLMRCAMPDATILAHPVFPDTTAGRGWFENADAFAISAAEFVKYLTTRFVGCEGACRERHANLTMTITRRGARVAFHDIGHADRGLCGCCMHSW